MKNTARYTPNLKDRTNPLKPLMSWIMPRPEGPPSVFGGPTPGDMSVNEIMQNRRNAAKQNKPGPADVAFAKRNPFLSGMDKAAQQDSMVGQYRRQQTWQRGNLPTNVYSPDDGDAWTTRKTDAPAGMTKRDRPTSRDAMTHARKRGLENAGYFSPEVQRAQELYRRQAEQEAKSWQEGLDLARKVTKHMAGKRGPGGTK